MDDLTAIALRWILLSAAAMSEEMRPGMDPTEAANELADLHRVNALLPDRLQIEIQSENEDA
jgi:hypothetical protein